MILDLILPGLSGEEALKKTGAVPVIAVSAKAVVAGSLEEERRRFAVLYRLGADERMQKWQTGAFFLMPFAFPLLMTVPIGVFFGKVYELWNLTGLSGHLYFVFCHCLPRCVQPCAQLRW